MSRSAPSRRWTPLRRGALIAIVLTIALASSASAATKGRYYLSLGDSLAVGVQPIGLPPLHETDEGYADQLYADLLADHAKLTLVKLGCGGESTVSMRFGSQLQTVVGSCGPPRAYKDLYPKGTQLAEAVSFLEAHKGKVELVTIDIGANDLGHQDADGNDISCLTEAAGCGLESARMVTNLAAILAELRAAAGPGVPIVGMTYYNAFAPLAVDPNPAIQALGILIAQRVDELNAALAATYAAAGVAVADVAGEFEDPDPVANVCAWTWFCTLGDVHPNSTGYGVIAAAFEEALLP
jgi:lysophospholipase L1-like esterase